MKMVLTSLALILAALAAAAAQSFSALYADMLEDPPAFSEDGDFVWDPEFDAGGFYIPRGGLQAGDWIISHLYLPAPDALAAWQAEGAPAEATPVWLDVRRQDSAWRANEHGQNDPVDTRRIRAASVMIEKARFDFRAEDEIVGEIVFVGFFHPDRLHAPPEAPPDQPALIGAADLGEIRVWSVDFVHWLGD